MYRTAHEIQEPHVVSPMPHNHGHNYFSKEALLRDSVDTKIRDTLRECREELLAVYMQKFNNGTNHSVASLEHANLNPCHEKAVGILQKYHNMIFKLCDSVQTDTSQWAIIERHVYTRFSEVCSYTFYQMIDRLYPTERRKQQIADKLHKQLHDYITRCTVTLSSSNQDDPTVAATEK